MNQKLLRTSLRFNVALSLVCGTELLFFSQDIASLFGDIQASYLLLLGIGLLAFAGVLFFVSKPLSINPKLAKIISYMDIGWVVGSIFFIALGHTFITTFGQLMILSIAFLVALCAYFQIKGIKQIDHSSSVFTSRGIDH